MNRESSVEAAESLADATVLKIVHDCTRCLPGLESSLAAFNNGVRGSAPCIHLAALHSTLISSIR